MRESSCEFLPINLVELLEIKFIQGLGIPSSPCGVYCSIFKTQPFASWSLISLTGICVPRTPAPGKLWFPVLFLLCLPWRILADLSIACLQLIQPYSSCVAGAIPLTSFHVQVGKQEVTGNHFLCRFPSLYGPWWRVCSNLQSSLICDFFFLLGLRILYSLWIKFLLERRLVITDTFFQSVEFPFNNAFHQTGFFNTSEVHFTKFPCHSSWLLNNFWPEIS